MGDMADLYDYDVDPSDWEQADIDEWVTADGITVLIKKLETKHLLHILNWIIREENVESVGEERCLVLEEEGQARGLVLGKDNRWRDFSMF